MRDLGYAVGVESGKVGCRTRWVATAWLPPVVFAVLVSAVSGCQSEDVCTIGPVAETGRLAGITAAHNSVRSRVTNPEPEPALPELRWNSDLAATASCWARELSRSGCRLRHSASGYGENLALFTGGDVAAEDVVQAWVTEERPCYTYGTFMEGDRCDSQCDEFGGCGHYTQLIWRDSTELGCGQARCDDGSEIWVCNYDPPGNFIGQAPY